MKRLAACLAVALLLVAGAGRATQQGQTVIRNWKQMDVCAKKAQQAYPDFTAEANAKRDAKLKECLNSGNLPPRALPTPAESQ